jgi:virginiamycin B lyase
MASSGAASGPDALVRFDPKAESFQRWSIRSGGVYAGIIRHICPTRGNLLIRQSGTTASSW